MFYDRNLMNSRSIGKVWRAANNLNDRSDEDINMSNICDKLNPWIGSYHEEVHRRLSLRTSSLLVDGVARLYKRKIQQLYDDVEQLDMDVTLRKKIRSSSGSSDSTTSPSENSPEAVARTTDSNATPSTSKTCGDLCLILNNKEPITRPSTTDKAVQVSPSLRSVSNRQLPGFDENLPFGFIVIHDSYKSRIPSRILFSSLNADIGKLG